LTGEEGSSDIYVREAVIKKVWDQMYQNDDHLLFGSRKTNIDLSALHPT